MPLDSPGPVSQALLGKNSKAATPVSSALTPTTAPQTAAPQNSATPASSPTPTSSSSAQQPPGNNVPDGFFSSAGNDFSAMSQNFSPNSTESDFPQQFVPTPPPQYQQFNPMHAWGSAAMMIALLGSAITKRPLTAALNAGAQVMSAFNQNVNTSNTQAYNTWQANIKNSYDIWKTNAANALQSQRYEMTYLSKIMSDTSMDDRTKETQVMEYARATKNYGLMQTLATQGLSGAEDYLNKYSTLGATLSGASFDVDTAYTASQSSDTPDQSGFSKNQWLSIAQAVLGGDASAKPEFASGKLGDIQKEEYDKAILQVRAQLPPGTASGGSLSAASLAALGKSWALGAPMSQLTAGLGSSASDVRAEITNYGINWLQSQGRDPTSFLVNESNYKANQELLDNMNKLAGNASAYEETTINNMNTAESLMGAGIPTNISPLLNQIAAYGEVQSGSPATLKFGAALATVFADYSKVMSGGTGSAAASSDSARQEAANLLPKFGTQAQTEAVFDVMRRDMLGKMNEYGNSLNAIDQAIQQGKIAADVGIEAPPAPYTPAPSSNGGGSIPAAGSTLHYDAQGNLVQ
jgi:hypothetical protein